MTHPNDANDGTSIGSGSVTAQGKLPLDAAAFERLLGELRPKLHRYCARMTGSVIDGEDVLQETLIKAFEAFPTAGPIDNPEGWIFRIAHNAALDFLRSRARRKSTHSDEDVTMLADPDVGQDERLAAAASLRTFMHLPVSQRGTVILKDVLGYSLEEIATVLDEATVASVKSALHRGRERLRELSAEPDMPSAPVLTEGEHDLLAAYIERFNARDFDALRDMLADEVRLDLVARSRVSGRAEVSKYYGYYEKLQDWRFVLGAVEGRPALLAFDPRGASAQPVYFVLLGWEGDKLIKIRDFRYARYAVEGAEFVTLE